MRGLSWFTVCSMACSSCCTCMKRMVQMHRQHWLLRRASTVYSLSSVTEMKGSLYETYGVRTALPSHTGQCTLVRWPHSRFSKGWRTDMQALVDAIALKTAAASALSDPLIYIEDRAYLTIVAAGPPSPSSGRREELGRAWREELGTVGGFHHSGLRLPVCTHIGWVFHC